MSITDVSVALRNAAKVWRVSSARPHPTGDIIDRWSALVNEWINDEDMPLLIRRSGSRGSVTMHICGRALVVTDNAPANFVYSAALNDFVPDLPLVRLLLEAAKLPVAMMLPPSELNAATYRGTQPNSDSRAPNLNQLGWKVCHVRPVGLKVRGDIANLPIDHLRAASLRFLNPVNMFLVPKNSGWGEVSEFIEEFSNEDRHL